ncbi:MAG: integrase arm-type DNA-binding domain-containing protein [Proteobacteria bacterium]|nr:integrase arm-type DNA-binding domain-containing protein [Pseudomonadota bacterium]
MLTPSAVRNAKPQAAPYKLRDERGMYLLVQPNDSRWWRVDHRRPGTGKRNTLSLGTFPDVMLKRAREKRDEARKLLADGIDPGESRKASQRAAEVRAANSFEAVAAEWLDTMRSEWVDDHTRKIRAWLEQHVNPTIGAVSIAELGSPDILVMLRKLVTRGTLNTAGRVREMVSAAFRYARRRLMDHAQGPRAPRIDHDGSGLLYCDRRGSHRQIRQAGDSLQSSARVLALRWLSFATGRA